MLVRASQTGRNQSMAGWCALDRASPYLVSALIHAEDPVFFQHRGIWWHGLGVQILRAVRTRTPVRAVSSITQQLARNLFLRPERSMRRKICEALIARRLERRLLKLRILELYLNFVEWGPGIWGVEAAAAHYFKCLPAALNAFEAIVLVSLLPAPLSPLTGRNAERAIRSQRRLASILYGSGVLSLAEESEVNSRISLLEGHISSGGGALAFLHDIAGKVLPGIEHHVPLTLRTVVVTQAGLARRVHYEQFLRESLFFLRGMSNWPMWWPEPSGPLDATLDCTVSSLSHTPNRTG